jgi:hypothetical protein
MRAALRQLRFPREFRIGPPAWNSDELSALEQVILLLKERDSDHLSTPSEDKAQQQLLRDLATGLWRIRQKMLEPGSGEPLAGMQKAYRHLQSTWDVLTEAGVEIQDHTGSHYDPGLSLSVIAHQPTRGIIREEVIETIKPSIYFNKVVIQQGEVIVGIPENMPQGKDREI